MQLKKLGRQCFKKMDGTSEPSQVHMASETGLFLPCQDISMPYRHRGSDFY